MRILLVCREIPDPNGVGVQRRAAQHLATLTPLGDVTVVLPHGVDDPDAVLALGAARVVVRDERPEPAVRRDLQYAEHNPLMRKWLEIRRPAYFDDRAAPAVARAYRARLGDDYDLIVAFRLASAVWVDSVFGPPSASSVSRVVDLDDVESVSFAAHVIDGPPTHRLAALRFDRDLKQLRRVERRLAFEWGTVVLCSDIDADRFEAATGVRPLVVPNATAFDDSVGPETDGGPLQLLFVGSFSYAPNVDGARWMVEKVWPGLIARLGDAVRLTLVGYNAPPSIMALDEKDGIKVVSGADSLTPFYEAANIVVTPIFAGSGTRIKVIEAAASGRAMVSTSMGCEGLGLETGRDLVVADDVEGFIQAVVDLANDPARRRSLAASAKTTARGRFAGEEVRAAFRKALIARAGLSEPAQKA